MRSVIIAIIVLILLAGGFGLFMLMQPETPVAQGPAAGTQPGPALTPRAPSTRSSESVIGEASGVWIQSFDRTTGALVSEFRAARYDPPKDGQVHVAAPEALFYMKDGQVMKVSADSGDVVMPEQTKRPENLSSIDAQPPSRGVLHNVTIEMLRMPDEEDPPQVILTVRIPILAFDNDTLRMNTVQTTIDGRDVLADRVPVTVTGEYEFEGEGLIVRYNQRDQRLEYLEITHGKRLTIRNPRTFGGGALPTGTRPTASLPNGAIPIHFVDADPAAAAQAAAEEKVRRERKARRAATRPTVSAKDLVAYRALFERDVRILEGDRQIGSAERMIAAFTFIDEPAETPAERRPTTPRRTRPATTPTTAPATIPATAPAAQVAAKKPEADPVPVTITWSGKLVVTPTEISRSGLRSLSDRSVEFVGSPVRLEREGALVEAASVLIGSVGNRFIARSSEAFPVVTLHEPNGMVLKTAAIDFSGDLAILQGRSSAELLVAGEKEQAPQKLTATWNDRATMHLSVTDADQRAIDQATFSGDVEVTHPQLKLNSDTLQLAFAPSANKSQPTLSGVDAQGRVRATVTGEQGAVQTISADTLRLGTHQRLDGVITLRKLDAGGNVVADDGKQKIHADRLAATFSADPKDASKVSVDELTAEGSVRFSAEDGTTAEAQRIALATAGEGQVITLTGKPATLQQKDSKLTGERIVFDSTTGNFWVVGAGSATGLARAPKKDVQGKSTPVEVSWTGSLDYIADQNRADISGGVVVASVNREGAIERATAKRMTIALVDDPKTDNNKPVAGQPADQTTAGIGGAGKAVDAITLDGEVEISSLLYAPDNRLLRRIHAFAPKVMVDVLPTGDLGSVRIDSGGQMLYEDLQSAPVTQPADKEDGVPVRGKVAIAWQRSMVYDPVAHTATLDGDVVVVQQDPGKDRLQMKANRLVAELDDAVPGEQPQLKRVVADQGATFSSKTIHFDTAEAIYEPQNNRVIARGTERQPVQVYYEGSASSVSYDELWWNIKDARPERLKNVTANVRQ